MWYMSYYIATNYGFSPLRTAPVCSRMMIFRQVKNLNLGRPESSFYLSLGTFIEEGIIGIGLVHLGMWERF